jgi:hypothetical protein
MGNQAEGTVIPPATSVPWATSPQVPGAQHCTQVGCPPVGVYEFDVRAVYVDGESEPSNIARCAITGQQACVCTGMSVPGPGPLVQQPPRLPPAAAPTNVPPLTTTPPFRLRRQPPQPRADAQQRGPRVPGARGRASRAVVFSMS